MMKINKILGFAVAVTAVCGLFLTSCEEPEPAVVAEVSVKTSQVTAKGGSMFVNVTCNGTWELSLKGKDAAISDKWTIKADGKYFAKCYIWDGFDTMNTYLTATLK